MSKREIKRLFKLANKYYADYMAKRLEVQACKNTLNTLNFDEWRIELIQYETLLTELNNLKENWEEVRAAFAYETEWKPLEKKINKISNGINYNYEYEFCPLKMYFKLLEALTIWRNAIVNLDSSYLKIVDIV